MLQNNSFHINKVGTSTTSQYSGRWSWSSTRHLIAKPRPRERCCNFAEPTYWNQRYRAEPLSFEWYRGYASLAPLLTRYMPPHLPVLQVGVGTSTMQHDMVTDGEYARIVNVDYSDVCIKRMAELHADVPQLEYLLADVKSMPFEGQSFASILDKGTLDALLCGDCCDSDAHSMMLECSRILQPGGVYLMVTHSAPAARIKYLDKAEYAWDVLAYEVGQQGALEGPYQLTGIESSSPEWAIVASLPRMKYGHFVYVCRRRG